MVVSYYHIDLNSSSRYFDEINYIIDKLYIGYWQSDEPQTHLKYEGAFDDKIHIHDYLRILGTLF